MRHCLQDDEVFGRRQTDGKLACLEKLAAFDGLDFERKDAKRDIDIHIAWQMFEQHYPATARKGENIVDARDKASFGGNFEECGNLLKAKQGHGVNIACIARLPHQGDSDSTDDDALDAILIERALQGD